ncbi:MAG: DUF1761 domain-containing protein [Terracidiphilus sp.]
MEAKHIRHNYLAILAAAAACVAFLLVWYEIFLDTWLKAIGHDRIWLASTGVSFGLQCVTALVAAALVAVVISGFTQLTGPQTAVRGMKVAAGMWLGCVLGIRAIQSIFEVRSYSAFAVSAGFWLLAMVMMGAIVGGWKAKDGE